MATQAAQTGPKYFTAIYNDDTGELNVNLADEKTESAHAFLTRVRTDLSQATLIDLERTGRSLQEIVTSIVSGYEGKRGIFQRIWDCILRIFGYNTDLDELTEIANEIQMTPITQNRYLSSFFTQELTRVIGFFRNLPHEEATLFFDRHRGIAASPAYCDPQDPSKARNLEGLNVKDYINLAEALCWYLQVYTLEYLNKPALLERKGDAKGATLFEQADAQAFAAVESSLSKILLVAAHQAYQEHELSRAAEYLSRTQRLAGDEDLSFVRTVVDDCLRRGSILHALQAVSNLKIESRGELELEIGRAGLKKALFTSKDFQALKTIALSSSRDKAFVIDFLDACIKQNEILRAYEVFVALGMAAPEERREAIALECIKEGHYKEAEYLASQEGADPKSREDIFVLIALSYLKQNRLIEAEEAACKISRVSIERNKRLREIANEHIRQNQLVKAATTLAHTSPSNDKKDNEITETLAHSLFDIFLRQKDFDGALMTFVGEGGVYFKMATTLYNRAFTMDRPEIALEACQHMNESDKSASLLTLIQRALDKTLSLTRLFKKRPKSDSGSVLVSPQLTESKRR